MKKCLHILIVFFTVILITGCANSNLKSINYNEFNTLINDKETFILVVSQTGCSHCEEFKPILLEALKESDVEAYELNITNISKKEYEKFNDKYSFEGTPTTMFFKNGKEILSSRLVGSTTKKELTKIFKRLNYTK